jgi:cytidylate kinase
MAVITVSRGSFSGGKILAECLADRLGYRCVDRDVIVERAAAYGVTQEELRGAMEKPPSFWDRFKHKKYLYLTLIQAALTEEVRSGKAVYHGNAGHLLLRGVSHVFRTRIIAPLDFRLALVQDRLRMSRNEALAYIQKMDQDRTRWTQYLYGVNWGDPALYDMVLNLEAVDIQEACEIIAHAVQQKCFHETPESVQAMEDLALASRVRASLAVNPATSGLEVDVLARGGVVSVRGHLGSQGEIREIQAATWKVPGVTEVNLDGLVPLRSV